MQAEEMKEADHKYKIQLCQEVLSVLDVVEPGLRLGRGNTISYGVVLSEPELVFHMICIMILQ